MTDEAKAFFVKPRFGNGTEEEKLRNALAELMQEEYVDEWLKTPNNAFNGQKPIDMIKEGKTDKLWHMIWEVGTGQPT